MTGRVLLAVVASAAWAADPSSTAGAPIYTADSIANSAANVVGYYAPNSFLSIYGQNLAYATKAISPDDVRNGRLPTSLSGVDVLINNIPGYIYYVSPGQVNVLIPTILAAGPATVQLLNNAVAGPPVMILLATVAPVLFQSDATTVIATHGNGPQVTPDQPAQPNEVVVLYATGLGATSPPLTTSQVPQSAAWIADRADFRVVLNGNDVEARLVQYAGVTPGFAGLFQINLQLPPDTPPNPEIRIGYGEQLSPAGRTLPVQ